MEELGQRLGKCYLLTCSVVQPSPPAQEQLVIKTSSTDLPTGQIDEVNFSVLSFPSKCLKLTIKLAVTFSILSYLYQSSHHSLKQKNS